MIRAIYLTSVLLIAIKAMGLTTLSWWIVTVAFWLPVAALAVFFNVVVTICIAFALIKEYVDKRKQQVLEKALEKELKEIFDKK